MLTCGSCEEYSPAVPPAAGADGRIPLEFRIGVTGHRTLQDPETVSGDLAIALQRILSKRTQLSTPTTPIGVTIVSSLAEGTDRLLVHELTRLHGDVRLEAVLPLPPEEYRTDFTTAESLAEFDALLATAARTEVVGIAGRRDVAYERAGRVVVDRSDVMIAVWDGQPARGRGGTARIIDYARSKGRPLVWIPPDERHRIIEESVEDDSETPSVGPLSAPAYAQLDGFNRARMPQKVFGAQPALAVAPTAGAINDHLRTFLTYAAPSFTRADELAKRNQARSLLVTGLVYTLAAVAVIIASGQLLFAHSQTEIVWGEVAALMLVSTTLLAARHARWHDRWASYRYLAERIRSAAFLAAAGIGAELDDIKGVGVIADPQDEWLRRAVAEIWLHRPTYLLTETIVGPLQRLLAESWIGEQLAYHVAVSKRNQMLHNVLTRLAIGFFTASVVAAVLHSLGVFGGLQLLGFLSVVIPAVGAAVSGYAAQREFAQQANRSRHMAAHLGEARRLILDAKDLDEVRRVAIGTEQLMRGENADWNALVHLHEVRLPG